ncbi:MAG TPA: DNA methyltransferase, partial [Candidatus Syntrophosphaera thermopropionivorans]|nr:DNA methyltransferase [Candidatus Syntrophosphaera thermopropionivorans]
MKANNSNQITLPIDEDFTPSYKIIILNKTKFLEELEKLENSEKLETIKNQIISLKAIINNYSNDFMGLINIDMNGDTISLRKDIVIDELDQILKSQTLERAKYYIKRLKNGINKVKTNKINDINLSKWKEYDDVLTDSLWIFDKRDTSGSHLGWYWGNFIPQIPHQIMMRYTKRNDWVLDCFLGSGTTLIES